jgi:hypothetical protein
LYTPPIAGMALGAAEATLPRPLKGGHLSLY